MLAQFLSRRSLCLCIAIPAILFVTWLALGWRGSASAASAEEPPDLLLSVSTSSREERAVTERFRALAAGPEVKRSRLVRFDERLLERLLTEDLARAAPVIRLALFAEVVAQVRVDRAQRDAQGFRIFTGTVQDDHRGAFNLVLNSDAALGTIDVQGTLYRLEQVHEDVFAILEIDPAAFPPEAPPLAMPVGAAAVPELKTSAVPQIDVLVLYTVEAREAAGGVSKIRTQIRLAITQLNQAFERSDIPLTVNLAGMAGSSLKESDDSAIDLEHLKNSRTAALLRSSWSADIVSLWVRRNVDCGRGHLMRTNSPAFAAEAFNVVRRDCATDRYTFAHEVGHNLGGQHDRHNADSPGIFPFSYGYQAPNQSFRTVLAYDCKDECSKILNFSNPEVRYKNQPTGVRSGGANAADNASTFRITGPTASVFSETLPQNTFGDSDVKSGKGALDPGLAPWLMGDVNGDGRADYCRLVQDGSNRQLACVLATADGTFADTGFRSGKFTSFDPGSDDMPRFLVDVNADLRADYCRFIGSKRALRLSCALATRNSFGNDDVRSRSVSEGFARGRDDRPRLMADVNGDGRADFCRFFGSDPDSYLSCALATPTKTFGNLDYSSAKDFAHFDPGYANGPSFLVDVDADGRADYCRLVGNPGNVALSCALAMEGGFGNLDVNSGHEFKHFDPGYQDRPRMMADINADGRADYCRFVGDPPYTCLSCALATAKRTFGNYDVNSSQGYDEGSSSLLQTLADVAASREAGYCRFVGKDADMYLSCGLPRIAPAPLPVAGR